MAAPVNGDARRAAIIKRLQELFNQQTERFHNYLTILEKQESLIISGSEEAVLALVEQEEFLVADILSIQRAIDPLEELYFRESAAFSSTDAIASLKAALEEHKNKAQVQSKKNRELLAERMANVRGEIHHLKNNQLAINARRSLYQHTGAASLIDIKG